MKFRRWRILIMILGLVIGLIAANALAYSFQTLPTNRYEATLAPSSFPQESP